jgi:hypothetical protein
MIDRTRYNRGRRRTIVVRWRAASPASVAPPVERRLPFLELVLEHPDIEPTQVGGSFFADALPYEARGEHRVFYWRFRLPPRCESPERWEGICATPRCLIPLPTDRHIGDEFVDRGERGVRLPVEASVAGESLDALVE